MNAIIVLLSIVALVSSVDVTPSGTFVGVDSSATNNALGITAGAALTGVSFTATPSDNTIAIYYPNSGTRTVIGSIANGATGYGAFQVLGVSGGYYITFNITYKKLATWYNTTATFPLSINNPDGGGVDGKRIVQTIEIEQDLQIQIVRNGNADFSIAPADGFAAPEATPTWNTVQVISNGPALSGVTYTVTPSDDTIAIWYGENGNTIGNVVPNGRGASSFQINGNLGWFTADVKFNYKKAGVPYTYTETLPIQIYDPTDTSGGVEGKMAVEGRTFLPFAQANSATVAGLAIGGIALIAIVAVVIVVVVVRRQRTDVIA